MFVSMIAMFFLGVGYAPPSEHDVLLALQTRFYQADDAYLDPILTTERYELRFNHYPVDTILKNCDPLVVNRLSGRGRNLPFRSGYKCLVEIISHAVPPYDVIGVFEYDGLRWFYHGDYLPRQFKPQDTINRVSTANSGRIILKPGSIPYDGNPENPINRNVTSPYADLLGFDRIQP